MRTYSKARVVAMHNEVDVVMLDQIVHPLFGLLIRRVPAQRIQKIRIIISKAL